MGAQSLHGGPPSISTISAKPRASSTLEDREIRPTLSPSPMILEPIKTSQDDTCVPRGPPVTPKRPGAALRGLSLQLSMPPRDVSSSSTANLTTHLTNRVPLSPKLDSTASYGSAAALLPRRSRGLDYTRACTNLHHSTLAEQSSPDSSPIIGGGRGMNIPRRGQPGASGPESPMFPGQFWSSNGGSEKTVVSGSLGSVNMMDSNSDSESSDDDLMRVGDEEDTIHMTPQPARNIGININPFSNLNAASPGRDMKSPFSQAAANLMSFQRRTRRGRSTRHSSSSASGNSTMPSPAPGSPPLLKSIESSMSGGYFAKEADEKTVETRRESLSLGTDNLHISNSVEGDDATMRNGTADALGIQGASNPGEWRNVIKRAVTRRSNMMPKTKTFARIRAALQEEISPVDTESKREAEVIRQVRESDHSPESTNIISQPATTASSPCLLPITTSTTDAMDDLTEMMGSETGTERRPSVSMPRPSMKSSTGQNFWNNFDSRVRTPPPPLFPRGSSTGLSEDVHMDAPTSSLYSLGAQYPQTFQNSSPSRSATPQPTTGDMTRKTLGKRRRDDDLDPNLFKRRAVSPGLSLQNSPVLPPSPAQRDAGWWQALANRETPGGHANGERLSSTSSGVSGTVGKRVGLQGMTDTNDGLMNMSIE